MERTGLFVLISTIISFFLVSCAGNSHAKTTWYVDDDAPADFATIQAAIEAASDGDTIIVRDGLYTGDGNRDINFDGKAVHLMSENGPDTCIISSGGSAIEPHRAFIFSTGEDSSSAIDGFTIADGYVDGVSDMSRSGGAIYCFGASPTIISNRITRNHAEFGAGVYCNLSSSRIVGNTIFLNDAGDLAGAIRAYESDLVILNNVIVGNTASDRGGGGVHCRSSDAVIGNNVIAHNEAIKNGGGIKCSAASPTVANNTIVANSAGDFGGGLMAEESSLPTVTVMLQTELDFSPVCVSM